MSTRTRVAREHIKRFPIAGISAAAASLLPMLAYAQTSATFRTIVGKTITLMQQAAGIFIGVGVALIAYGILKYMTAGDDPERLREGGKLVLWGVISVFVMLSIYGIINIFIGSFFTTQELSNFQLSNQLFNSP